MERGEGEIPSKEVREKKINLADGSYETTFHRRYCPCDTYRGKGERMGYSGKVEICGVNTAKLKVLKNEEMVELLRRIREGDMSAREEMISGNLRLVLSVLQRFAGRGENVDDLFQVGCIGLIKAIDNFDPSQNVRFSTYGVPMTFRSRKS